MRDGKDALARRAGGDRSGLTRLVGDNLSIAVRVGPGGHIEQMSPRAAEIFGERRSDAPTRLGDIFLAPPKLTGRRRTEAVLAVRHDGTPFSATITRLSTGLWPRRRHTIVFTNEMDRLHAEQRLRETATLLASVLRAVTDPVVVRDASGRVVAINEAAAALADCPHDVLENATPQTIGAMMPAWMVRALAADTKAASAGLPRVEDLRREAPEGAVRWFRWSSYPLPGAPGQANGCITIARDISRERADAAALTHAKEQAERADFEKSRFLGAASHDLRQPIQAMYLQLGVLQNCALDDRAGQALSRLERSMDTMRGLLDNLLDLRQLEAGAVKPSMGDFELDPLLEEIEASTAASAAEKGLRFSISACEGITVHSDRVRLGQMVQNLVQNAIRYTDAGSVELVCRANGSRVSIEVRDTGIGIPADRVPHIWGEFVQLGNPERDRSRGVGLGLSIVARLSRLLDHPVDVRTEVGRGSSFFVDVPLARPGAALKVAVLSDPVDAAGRLAVVIDDDDKVLTGLELYLEDAGYRVVASETVEAAISELDGLGARPDVILADYRLRNGKTGLDAVSALRVHVGDDVPAAILTGETDGDLDVAAAACRLSVLHKPITGPQLTHALAAMWRRAS